MARAKKTRKELLKEPDEFITFTGKMIRWATAHQSQLTYALLAITVIVLGLSAWRYFSVRAEANAAALLQQAVAKYDRLAAEKSAAAAYSEVSADFNRLVDKYGNKNNGKMARLRYANICYEAGKFKHAAELYSQALSQFEDFPLLRNRILIDLAMTHAAMGEDQAAIDYFEQIVAGQMSANKDEALFHLGRLYSKTGQHDKSLAAFSRLSSEFKDSNYTELVPKPSNG